MACLRSLTGGTYPLHEIIVYDNGSTDDTVQRVAASFPDARVVCHERNMGLSYCHNRAMREFTGDLEANLIGGVKPDVPAARPAAPAAAVKK